MDGALALTAGEAIGKPTSRHSSFLEELQVELREAVPPAPDATDATDAQAGAVEE